MLKKTLITTVAMMAFAGSALALDPQPEPPGVNGKINRVQQGNAIRSNPSAKPTEAAGSDSGSDGHGKNAHTVTDPVGNPSEKKTWAAGSDSGEGKTIKKTRLNNLSTHQ